MKACFSSLLAALFGAAMLTAAPIASAHGYDHREWHDGDRGHGWERGPWDNGYGHRSRIVERTVIVRDRPPVVYEPVYVRERPIYVRERPVYVEERPIYRRDPSVVISVGLPPLVFPIH